MTKEQEILKDLVNTIQATGGVIKFTDGVVAPAGDEEWTDLGSIAVDAHEALLDAGIDVELDVEELALSSKASVL